MKKNNKAQIGTTLTWFAAFLIIFLIMLLFFAITAVLVAKKNISLASWFSGDKKNLIEFEKGFGNLEIQGNMINLLKTSVKFNQKEIFLYDLIYSSDLNDKEASKVFNEVVLKEFSKDFPYEGWTGRDNPWWVRVYNANQNMNQWDKYNEEQFRPGENFHTGGFDCNPDTGDSIVTSVVVADKKIVSCILKSYYTSLK